MNLTCNVVSHCERNQRNVRQSHHGEPLVFLVTFQCRIPSGFQWPPRRWPCHYQLLVFAIMPCLLLSLPLAVARCLCNTAYYAWSSALFSPWEESICPNGSHRFLLLLLCFLPARVKSGSPVTITNMYGNRLAWVWSLFFMKSGAQRQNILKWLDGARGLEHLAPRLKISACLRAQILPKWA